MINTEEGCGDTVASSSTALKGGIPPGVLDGNFVLVAVGFLVFVNVRAVPLIMTTLLLLNVLVIVLVLVGDEDGVGDLVGRVKPIVPVVAGVSDESTPTVFVGGIGVSDGVTGRGDLVQVGGN